MKRLLRITTLVGCVLATSFAAADSLQFVNVNGATTPNGAEYTGPYQVAVNGTVDNLYCLNLNRAISFGETWTATPNVLSTTSSLENKEAAIILNYISNGTIDQVTGQLGIWAILDSSDAVNDGLPSGDLSYLPQLLNMASNNSVFGDSFYSRFTMYAAVDATQSANGTPQDFIGASSNPSAPPVPEPSSLVLLGTGLFGSAGILYRRSRSVLS